MTEDRSKVTCARCIKHFAWVDARAAQAAQRAKAAQPAK